MSERRVTSQIIVVLACLIIVIAGLKSASDIVVPFLLAMFIAMLCSPLMGALTRRKVPSVVAVLLLVLLLLALGVGFLSFVGSTINAFYGDMPLYEAKLQAQMGGVITWLGSVGVEIDSQSLQDYINPGAAIKTVASIFNGLGGALTNTFLILFTVVFILLESSSFSDKAKHAFGSDTQAIHRVEHFMHMVQRYFVIKTLISLGTGALIGVVLAIMGVDYWALWALVAFLFNYVPNIGSIIAAVPAVLISLIQLGVTEALLVLLLYVSVNTFFGNVVEPRYMGRSLGLSTLVVFLSLIVWGWVLGPVGMLLSVPLTMVAKIALENRESTRWLAILLSH